MNTLLVPCDKEKSLVSAPALEVLSESRLLKSLALGLTLIEVRLDDAAGVGNKIVV